MADSPDYRQPHSELVRLYQVAREADRGCRDRSPLGNSLPLGQHRPLDGTQAKLGSRQRDLPRRRGSEQLPRPPAARVVRVAGGGEFVTCGFDSERHPSFCPHFQAGFDGIVNVVESLVLRSALADATGNGGTLDHPRAVFIAINRNNNKGCRYYLGQWKDEKFTPEFHARMNWKGWDFFAPESVLTPDGRRVMWAWCNLGSPQSGIQSLPRELSLPDDGVLRIKPLRELESLRYDERSETQLDVKSDVPYRLKEIAGDALELDVTLKPSAAAQFGIEVYCDKHGTNGFPIVVEPTSKTLRLGDTIAPFELQPGGDLELRVFIDKNVIEVFANERQAVVATHKYAAENRGVSLFSKGGDVSVKDVRGWKMKSIYTGPTP